MFQIGERVICVEDQPHIYSNIGSGDMHGLKKGRLYEVRWVGQYNRFVGEGPYYGVRVAGILRDLGDVPYDARRFRPIRKGKTDISVFTALLVPKRKKEKENVC